MILVIIAKLIVGLGILNVWILRASKPTSWRGLDSLNLKEEFAAYALNTKVFYLVGAIKISASIGLIMSIWYQEFTLVCSLVLATTLIGSILMHLKVKDPIKKCLPAASLILLLCFILIGE